MCSLSRPFQGADGHRTNGDLKITFEFPDISWCCCCCLIVSVVSRLVFYVFVRNAHAVSFHNFKSSVSNPKSKYVVHLSVLSQISNCQGLGSKNKHEILKTDRTMTITITITNITITITNITITITSITCGRLGQAPGSSLGALSCSKAFWRSV